MFRSILASGLFAAYAACQSTSISATALGTANISSLTIITGATASVPTGSYSSVTGQITVSTTGVVGNSTMLSNGTMTGNSTMTATAHNNSTTTRMSTSTSNTLLAVGSAHSSTATGTSSAAAPTNTQPCNNYPEFCNRQYSNITEVCAHNSAFSLPNNVFSNQELSITTMLNDGIRMIQGETHYVNNTIYSCHTSCDFLNAGTYESELTTVREWLDANPFNVVTLLIVNSDYINVENYTTPFKNSGMLEYVYEPPKIPMRLGDWPTLGELILTGKRAVVFMDYQANQNSVPYIMDEFSQMWETPFSPTDPAFPCVTQRPPGITTEQAQDRLYLINHNLDLEMSIAGMDVLIPVFSREAELNAVTGNASLGVMANECVQKWNRPPNFLLVDFYNEGNFSVGGNTREGSVFEVAANMNNVTYNRSCCGEDTTLNAAVSLRQGMGMVLMIVAMVSGLVMFW